MFNAFRFLKRGGRSERRAAKRRSATGSFAFSRRLRIEPLEDRRLLSVGPVAGKGMWIWNIDLTEGGNVSAIIGKLQSANVDWVAIKSGDSDSFYSGRVTAEKITQFHNAGIEVLGWQFTYSYDVWGIPNVSEADVANTILSIPGIDGLIVNAENANPLPGQQGWDNQGKGPVATAYMQAIRAVHPSSFIAYSTFARIDSHLWFPYLEFGKYSDVAMPQTYWGERPTTPQNEMSVMKGQWDYWYQVWSNGGHADSVKPIVPTGQAYKGPNGVQVTPQEITAFCEIAESDGYEGVSLFRYAQSNDGASVSPIMTDPMWQAYAAAFNLGSDSQPPTVNAFDVQPRSITVGSAVTISYTVSDTGGSGLDHVELWRTNTYPIWPGPGQYEDINPASGNGPVQGSFSNTIMSAGDWYYGIHVVDTANNRTTETQAGWQPIHVTVNPAGDDHGNNAGSATPVGTNFTAAGSIEISGDVDWFRFNAIGGYQYVFETVDGGLGDSFLWLIGTNGTTELDSDDDGGPGLMSRIEWTAPGNGAYYLEVSGYGSYTGYYGLEIAETPPPILPGDYNQDLAVDAADYVVWRKTLGATGVPAYSGADGTGDGTIDQDDYGVWTAHFGETLGAGSVAQGAGSEEQVVTALVSEVRGQETLAQQDRFRIADFGLRIGESRESRVESRVKSRESRVEGQEPERWRDDALVAWLASQENGRGSDAVKMGAVSGEAGVDDASENLFESLDAAFDALAGEVSR